MQRSFMRDCSDNFFLFTIIGGNYFKTRENVGTVILIEYTMIHSVYQALPSNSLIN